MPASDADVRWDPERGVWYARPYLGTNKVTGRPMRPRRSFPEAGSREEAQAACDAWLSSKAPELGLGIGSSMPEVALSYVAHLEASGCAPGTAKAYRSLVRRYVAPVLGAVDVGEARPWTIEGAYAVVMARGGRGGSPVSPRTVSQLHWLLSGMYKWAVRIGLTEANPMPSVSRPRWIGEESQAFDEDAMARISRSLEEAMRDPSASREAVFRRNLAMAAWTALRTGARCGEALAITRAKSVSRRGGRTIRIDSTVVELPGLGAVIRPATKGKRGRNVSVTAQDMEVMRAHAAWQDGSYIARPAPSLPLCCLEGGAPMRPSSASRAFTRTLSSLGLPPGTSFHTLRHTHATWLLYNGVDIRTVSERLGHAKVTTTLELYAHVLPGRDDLAAEAFGEVMERIDDERG